jgi:tetratricopeptide (TPR) repeat protein
LPSGTVACIDTDGDGTDEVAVLRGEIALFARREEYLEKIAMLPCDLDVRTSALTAADVDGDGHSEVVCILGHYARRLWVLRTPGLAPIPFDPEIHQDIEQCLALDIDGDGDDELLLCGGKYGSTPELTNSLALADLTDGRLVIRGSYDEKCRLWSVPAPVPCGTECEAGICVAVYASAAQPELPFRNVRYAPCGLHVIHIARDGTFRFRSHQPLPPDTTDAICFRTPLGGPNTAWQGVQTRDDLLIFAPDAPDHPVCIPSFIGSVLRPVRDFSGRIAGFLQVQVAPKAAPRLLGIGRHPIERAQDPAPRWLWNWYDVARELERIRAFEGAADAYRAAGDGVGVARCLIRGNADRPERAEWASAQMLETLDNSETETARALTLVAPVAGIARKPEQQRRAAEVLRRLADRPDLDEGWKSMLRRKADLLDARANATVVWSLPDAEAMPPLEAGTPWSLRRCDDGTWRWSRVWGDSSFFRLRFRAQDLKMAAIRLEGRIERLDWGAALPLAVAAGGSRSADWSDRPLSPIATSIGPGPTTYLHQPQVWLSNRSVPIPFACGRDIEVELTYESTLWPEPAYCEVILRPSGSDPHRAAEPLPTPIASGTLLVGDPQGHVLPQLPAPYRGIVAIRRLEVVAPPNSLTPDTDWQPRTPIEHYWVANGFYGLGQWQKAEEHYTLCLESVSDPNPSPPKDGTNPAVWVWRARLFRAFARMRLGREEDAREDFRSAFERSPVWTLATIGPHVPVLDDAERRFAGTMLRPFLENRDALAAWAQKYVEQSAGNPYWTIGTRFGFGLLEIALPERMDGKLFRLLHEDVGRYFAGGYAEGAVEALREAARISPERTESVLEWVLNRSNPQQWSGSHERLAGDLWYALARDYDQRGDREAAQRCRDRVEGSY